MDEYIPPTEEEKVDIICRYCRGAGRRYSPELNVCEDYDCCRQYFTDRGSVAARTGFFTVPKKEVA